MLRTIEVNKEVTEAALEAVLGSMASADEKYEEVKTETQYNLNPNTGVKEEAGRLIGVSSKDMHRNFAIALPLSGFVGGIHRVTIQGHMWPGISEYNKVDITEDLRIEAINEFATALKAALEA